MNITEFSNKIEQQATQISFKDTMAVIEENYLYTPTAFTNGDTKNAAGTNEGSCKIFAFAQLQNFDKETTLQCFGDYYRKDVLENPDGSDHANIRNFMLNGWEGILFESAALKSKS